MTLTNGARQVVSSDGPQAGRCLRDGSPHLSDLGLTQQRISWLRSRFGGTSANAQRDHGDTPEDAQCRPGWLKLAWVGCDTHEESTSRPQCGKRHQGEGGHTIGALHRVVIDADGDVGVTAASRLRSHMAMAYSSQGMTDPSTTGTNNGCHVARRGGSKRRTDGSPVTTTITAPNTTSCHSKAGMAETMSAPAATYSCAAATTGTSADGDRGERNADDQRDVQTSASLEHLRLCRVPGHRQVDKAEGWNDELSECKEASQNPSDIGDGTAGVEARHRHSVPPAKPDSPEPSLMREHAIQRAVPSRPNEDRVAPAPS